MDDETIRKWVQMSSFYRPVPRVWVIEFMKRRGLTLVGSHFPPLPPGTAELLVFRKIEEVPSTAASGEASASAEPSR